MIVTPELFSRFFHRQRYTSPFCIHIEHGYHNLLVNFDHINGIPHETVSHLADMNETVMVHTYIDKSPE